MPATLPLHLTANVNPRELPGEYDPFANSTAASGPPQVPGSMGTGLACTASDGSSRRAKRHPIAAIAASASATRPVAIASEDWDDLLRAVMARLRQTVGNDGSDDSDDSSLTDPASHEVWLRAQSSVLDCVHALEQLRASRMQELTWRQQLELDVFDTRTALAQTRAQLFDTQTQARHASHRALHDSLTTLPNQAHFRQRLDDALEQARLQQRSLAVLYLDLDDFKPINDRHGHETGDHLLKIVALRLRRAVRAEDVVSRLGGDEFACLLADVSCRQQLSQRVHKLFDAVSGPLKIGAVEVKVRPSIGVVMCTGDGATGDTLLRRADEAMYRAKRQRSGYAFFDQPITS